MTISTRRPLRLVPVFAIGTVLGAAADALAQSCAMCGSGLSDDPLGRAISWSILFLMAGYGALRYGDPTWPRPSSILGIQLTAVMTFLLICSSVTMVEALAAIRRGDRDRLERFLFLTILGGMIFLGLQAFEWNKLILHEGQSISRNDFGATFFILTGFHGCHVFGGVCFLSVLVGRPSRGVSG